MVSSKRHSSCIVSIFRITILELLLKSSLCYKMDSHLPDGLVSKNSKIAQEIKLDIVHGRGRVVPKAETVPSCVTSERATDRLEHHTRHPRESSSATQSVWWNPSESASSDTAVYFTGQKQVLRLRVDEKRNYGINTLPHKAFSVDLWIKPEGGQYDPVSILGLVDTCSGDTQSRGWSIGIKTAEGDGEKDPRIYFSVRTDRANQVTTILSNSRYKVSKWLHVAAVYTGTQLKLYIDGAMVRVGHEQIGDVFNPGALSCKAVELGGRAAEHKFYRGYVSVVRIWNRTLTHGEIANHTKRLESETGKSGLLFDDSFANLNNWVQQPTKKLSAIKSDFAKRHFDLHLSAPLCGKTVCDDPDIISEYTKQWELRQPKVIRYRVINVLDDNGTNPTVTDDQIRMQDQALLHAFGQYNISWELTIANVTNSFLRKRLILFGCHPKSIGDGKCDKECQTAMTGNDGGDCDSVTLPCRQEAIGNGECDYECDRAYFQWDGGDCCQDGPLVHQTCFDPGHHLRAYLSVEEYREVLGYDGTERLNVYFASWTVKQLIGLATFPWEKNVYTVQGGTIVQPENFGIHGSTDSLVHEIGHNLGLWHVHHGVSEMECNDKCLETHASLTLGDLCSDTVPTPHNSHCRDPDVSEATCGVGHFRNTPFRNYMSYADDDCTNHFTPQQIARMHCYLDLVYQPWRTSRVPTPVPIRPKVVDGTDGSVSLAWVPPLGSANTGDPLTCSACLTDGSFAQYADRASSRNQKMIGVERSPIEATGPPDADRCEGSTRVWLPNLYTCLHQCYLDVTFKEQVVPQRFLLWATWNAKDGIENVVFHLADGTTFSLGAVPTYCDIPFTVDLSITQKVTKIRVYVSTPFVGIDAVQLISSAAHPACHHCKPVTYKLSRSPPFQDSKGVYTSDTLYTDTNLYEGVTYSYSVFAVSGSEVSPPSPTVSHVPGKPYCGDGLVNSDNDEDCDDGNISDGDGCSLSCTTEPLFHCAGSPSLCYIHDGDGVCEDFEKEYSVRDCGFFTPEGYMDQWASSAFANPDFQGSICPESVIRGPPPPGQGASENGALGVYQVDQVECSSGIDHRSTWIPCRNFLDEDDYWVKVYFPRPVVVTEVIVHFGSDGKTDLDSAPKSVTVELISEGGQFFPVGQGSETLSCRSNPLHVPVTQVLNEPFVRSKGVKLRFTSYNIGISAVRLRSSKYLDPVTLKSCDSDQLYDLRSGSCVARSCSQPSCSPVIIKHGLATCTGNGEGDTCRIQCKDGYRLTSELGVITCVNAQWEGGNEVQCSPTDCGRPVISHASVACPEGTTFGKECVFKCNRPARLQGDSTSVRCETDGLWSMPNSFCRVLCQAPPKHQDAALATKSCKRGRHDIGKRCKFRCTKGYHVEGRPRRRRVVKLTCEADGRWYGPRCVPITCSEPDPIFTGLYQCSNEVKAGSQCYLSCPDDRYNQQQITCLENGKWDASFRMCRFSNAATCPSLKNYGNGLNIQCDGINPGSTCMVRCQYSHQRPVINRKNFEPERPDPVLIITCTGSRRWYPNVADISCIESCHKLFIGDGWCDAKNNRAQCFWDGGDCCSSTIEGRLVQPFPDTCTGECTCKDPEAIENQSDGEASNRSKSVTLKHSHMRQRRRNKG